jgi:hypothetical protein
VDVFKASQLQRGSGIFVGGILIFFESKEFQGITAVSRHSGTLVVVRRDPGLFV